MRHHDHSPRHRANRVAIGLGVIGLGALALADNLGGFERPLLRTYWPLILVVIGLAKLLRGGHPARWLFGATLMGAGLLMTAHNLGQLQLDLRHWWPVFVILAGVAVLLKGLFPQRWKQARESASRSGVEHGERIEIDASFSAVELKNDSRSFKGGRISSNFGGIELDLTSAAIADGEATLDIDVSFCGIELRVPRDWQVVVQVSTTLGGVDDKTVAPLNPSQRLILRGDANFSGIEIRH